MNFKELFKAYLIGFFISWVALAGMANAAAHVRYPNLMQRRNERMEELGFSVIWAGLASTIWPVTLPCGFCLFGFGTAGWSLSPNYGPPKSEEQAP